MTCDFRPYTIADRAACLELFDSNCPEYFAPSERRDYEAFLDTKAHLVAEAHPGRAASAYTVCLSDARVCGAYGLLFGPGNGRARLRWIMIDASERGRGMGTTIMHRVLQRLAASTARVLDITTSHKATAFFERFGARETARIPDGWGGGLDRVEMELGPFGADVPSALETARLHMRVARAGDGPIVHEAIRESIVELRSFLDALPWVAREPTLESAERHCLLTQCRFLARTEMSWLLFERETGYMVGAAGLYRPDWTVPAFEVGYWCRTSRTGNGFMTEAVGAVTKLAVDTLGARRVELITDAANRASRRVAERTGFVHEEARTLDEGSEPRTLCVYVRGHG